MKIKIYTVCVFEDCVIFVAYRHSLQTSIQLFYVLFLKKKSYTTKLFRMFLKRLPRGKQPRATFQLSSYASQPYFLRFTKLPLNTWFISSSTLSICYLLCLRIHKNDLICVLRCVDPVRSSCAEKN